MAPVLSTMSGSLAPGDAKKKRRILLPAIPLEREEAKPLVSGEYHQYKLRTNPTKKDSPTFELQVPYFAQGSPEMWLKTKKNILLVIRGQNVNDYANKLEVVRRILKGAALTAFNSSVTAQASERQAIVEHNNTADPEEHQEVPDLSLDKDLLAVTTQVFPPRAYVTQCRWMRRHLKNPEIWP